MKTALIMIDVINDFFHPNGPNFHPSYNPILKNIKQVLKAARRNGITIVHTMESHHPGNDNDFEWIKLSPHCIQGSFEASLAEGIEILPGEFTIHKRRYSAFFATDLDLLLRENGIKQLFVIGVKTHVCIRATIQDAFGYGYIPIVIKEAVGSQYTHLHEASLEDIHRYMGKVIDMDTGLGLLQSSQQNNNDT